MHLNWLLIVQVMYSYQKINFQLVFNTTILGGVARNTATWCVSSVNKVSCHRVWKNERGIASYCTWISARWLTGAMSRGSVCQNNLAHVVWCSGRRVDLHHQFEIAKNSPRWHRRVLPARLRIDWAQGSEFCMLARAWLSHNLVCPFYLFCAFRFGLSLHRNCEG